MDVPGREPEPSAVVPRRTTTLHSLWNIPEPVPTQSTVHSASAAATVATSPSGKGVRTSKLQKGADQIKELLKSAARLRDANNANASVRANSVVASAHAAALPPTKTDSSSRLAHALEDLLFVQAGGRLPLMRSTMTKFVGRPTIREICRGADASSNGSKQDKVKHMILESAHAFLTATALSTS